MLRETGHVESVQEGFAWVVCASRADCKLCAEGRGCGGGLLGRMLGDRLHRVRVTSPHGGLLAGDRVEISLQESALVLGAIAAYGLPLFGFLALPIVAFWLFDVRNDFGLLGLAVIGLVTGVLLARRLTGQHRLGQQFQPAVTRKLPEQCTGFPAVDSQ